LQVNADGELAEGAIKLSPGSNLLRVTAADATNVAESTQQQFVFLRPSARRPIVYSLSVNVSQSAERDDYEIRYAENDSEDFKSALRDAAQTLYEVDDDHLSDPKAQTFLDRLRSVAQRARPQDIIVFFFSGTSLSTKEGRALVFSDYNGTSATGLVDSLDAALGSTQGKLLVLIDSWERDSDKSDSTGFSLVRSWNGSYFGVSSTVARRDLARGLVAEAALQSLEARAADLDPVFVDALSFQKAIQARVVNRGQELNLDRPVQLASGGENFILMRAAEVAQAK
jgi:hypothetical protein